MPPYTCSPGTECTWPAGERNAPWRPVLDGIIAILHGLPEATEKKFIEVGRRLNEISFRLGALGSHAGEAYRMMAGEEAQLLLAELQSSLDLLETRLVSLDRRFQAAPEAISRIIDELSFIHRLTARFGERVGALRTLKVLVNIQSATLGGRFGNVADSLQRLSVTIRERSGKMTSTATGLSAELHGALGLVEGLSARQQELGHSVLGSIHDGITSLADVHRRCTAEAKGLSEDSSGISAAVGDLILSLQVHDITRQQMNHVEEALREAVSPGKYQGEEYLGEVCGLEGAQISHCSAEILKGCGHITRSLAGISAGAAAATGRLRDLFGLADSLTASSLPALEAGLSGVVRSLEENIGQSRRLVEVVASLAAAVSEVTTFVSDMDDIADEIRLIALNAIIKAAQAGEEGAGFSVIAQSVKSQSDDMCTQAASIAGVLTKITLHLERLQEDLREEERELGEMQALLSALDVSLLTMKKFEGNTAILLRRAEAESGRLTGEIAAAAAAIGMDSELDLLRREVVDPLERLAAELRGKNPPGEPLGFDALSSRYTMRSERLVHDRYTGNASAGEAGEFGDNVELF